MKTCFIVNLRSGRAAKALGRVREFAAERGAEVRFTERARHACEIAARAAGDGFGLVVAVGGDGTMNEVASALIGTPTVLGLVPCGSGDGLGRHLGLHGSVEHALSILDAGAPKAIDTGLADGHAFVAVAGLGFEAHIAEKFNRLQRRGFRSYLSTSATELSKWVPLECAITCDGRRERLTAFTLAVANTNQYGNAARIAPGAAIDDGLLDLCCVPRITLWNAGPLVARLFTGRMATARGIRMFRSVRFVVERPSPGPIHTDGEIHHAGACVEFEVRPASLRIMIPRSTHSV